MEQPDNAMGVYEEIVNAESASPEELPALVDRLAICDESGQFLCSGARYLHALNSTGYAPYVDRMVDAAIDRDREHKYIAQLLPALWGEDFMQRADKLRISDNNFRRIFKRIYPDH